MTYRLVWRRPKPVAMEDFDLPGTKTLDRPLLVGAAIFGVGWGIGGFCPGPAWTALPLMAPGTLVFVPAMLIGMLVGGPLKAALAKAPAERAA